MRCITCTRHLYHPSDLRKGQGDTESLYHPAIAPPLTCDVSLYQVIPLRGPLGDTGPQGAAR